MWHRNFVSWYRMYDNWNKKINIIKGSKFNMKTFDGQNQGMFMPLMKDFWSLCWNYVKMAFPLPWGKYKRRHWKPPHP